MKRWLGQARKLALYVAIPGVSAVTPLLVYPAVTTRFGADGLAAVGIAQSIGIAFMTVSELGWSVLGPQRIGRATPEQRRGLYDSALATRLAASAILAPIAAVVAYFLATDHQPAAALLAAGFTLNALSPSWYLVGENKPLTILLVESLPRLALYVVAAALILAGSDLMLYGIAVGGAALLSPILFALFRRRAPWPSRLAFRSGVSVIRTQLPVTGGRAISVLYTSFPIALVGIVSPASVAVFTAAERLMRMGLGIVGAVPSRLQSWIGAVEGADLIKRSRMSLLFNTILGLVCGIIFVIAAPIAAQFIFSNSVEITLPIAIGGGCVIAAVCTSRGFGLSLVAEGAPNGIALANVGAAVTGVSVILVAARSLGAVGGFIGELASELVGIAIQAAALLRKRPGAAPPSAP